MHIKAKMVWQEYNDVIKDMYERAMISSSSYELDKIKIHICV